MSIQNPFSNAKWNKATLRILLARIMQVLFILIFLVSPIGTPVQQVYAQDPVCPCSIWLASTTPANSANAEALPVELGVKFRSDVDGYITAIRFYKGAGNNGPHYGHLWTNAGVQLGQVLFTNESTTGWQEAIFPTPLAITAGTTYIASYHTPTGHWSYDANYFTSQTYNAPLRALANGDELPGNGVYRYGDSGSFPTESYNAMNYWVDLVFNETVGPDNTPPTVVAVSPAAGSTDIALNANVTAQFSEAMEPTMITAATLVLRDALNNVVTATVSYTSGNYTALINPEVDLAYSTTYTVTILGGESGVTDLAGNELASNHTWSFTTIAPDTTPPTVVYAVPAAGSTGIAVNSNVSARFSEAMALSTITTGNLELRDAVNNLVSAAVSYASDTYTATIDPDTNLAYSSTYTALVKGGEGGVADMAGNELAVDYTWSFTTAAPPPPPPDEGPGGPILVIADAGNPFGRYYAEILRNEGLNEFTVTDISLVTASSLEGYDVVLLAELSRVLTADEVGMLTNWVNAGGNLIAMRPDAQLAGLLGLTRVSGVLPATGTLNAYLLISTSAPPGQGLVDQTIQYHGQADLYELNGAGSVATLYSNATAATTHPAVSLKTVGTNGGEAAAFTYDLARSVVYTRQGNPAWAGQNRDPNDPSVSRIISHDMYFGNASGDPQPDYIDWNKITIPQADEQMRLLAKLIQHMNRDKKPLPNFWYFPRGEKAVVIMTGDDHGSGNTVGRFNHYLDISPVGCSVQDWECIRGSSFMFMNSSVMTPALAASFNAQGFEVGLHVNTGCVDWTPASLANNYESQLASWDATYVGLERQMSERTHCVNWTDWATQPKVQALNGIRMDTNYYYYPPAWVQERPGMFTGSGMVMRFADLDGTMIDVYQAVTQMTDESSLQGYGYVNPIHINTLLDNAVGTLGYYGAFTANMHTDSVYHAGSETIINAAVSRGVPVVSGKQMVTWLDGRNGSSFENIAWSGGVLSFDIQQGSGSNGLQGLVPFNTSAGFVTSITRGGSPIDFTREIIKGVEYAIFPAQTGSYSVTYTPDTTAPVISDLVALPSYDGTARIEWTTDEASDTHIDYGISADALTLSFHNTALVTSHVATLTGLTNNQRYYFRVSSTDVSGNIRVYPPAGEPAASFNVPSAALVDTTFADFSAGTLVSGVYISNDQNGEAKLAPTVASEFNGSALPTGWFTAQYPSTGSGGTAFVSGGLLTLNGTRVGPDALLGSGHSLEFVANFSGAPYQHIGFGVDYFSGPWAIFSTDQTGNIFQARTNNSSTSTPNETSTILSSSLLGTTHRFRIEWRSDQVLYFIDDTQVASHAVTISQSMRPMAADYQADGGSVGVDWMRVSPYQTPGIFQSRVFDAFGTATWGAPAWTANVPLNTTMLLSVRTGDTPMPDGSWSAFTPVSYGAPIGRSSRYLQYQLDLSTTDSLITPVLYDISFGYNVEPDETPPAISNRVPVPNANTVSLDSNVVVIFDEAMDPGTINISNIRLRAFGAGQDVPAAVSYIDRVATLNPDTDLTMGMLYQVTVSGDVKDVSGNALGSDDTWSFTTAAIGGFTDTTEADFNLGTPGTGCYVANTTGGELILGPTVGAEFSGSLPGDWFNSAYGSAGTASFNNGWLVLDGRMAGPNTFYASGRWLEFYGTFSNGLHQHVGFSGASNFSNPPWAIFSTSADGTMFQARSSNGSTSEDTNISSLVTWNGTPHRYRIEWNTNSIVFFVDGITVATHTRTISDQMHPLAAEYNTGGKTLLLDWLRLGPYTGNGVCESHVFDAGTPVHWSDLTWVGSMPIGTSVSFETRTGDVATPDGTWSDWQAVNSPIASPDGQYIQYRANLGSSDDKLTPEIQSVSITFNGNAYSPVISGNAGVGGATLSYTDGTPKTVTADGNGDYSLTVSHNWSGTVTPSKAGYSFTPVSKTYAHVKTDQTGQNYIATQIEYTLTLATVGNGIIEPDIQPPYHLNEVINLTAVPDTGWAFVSWSGHLTGTTNPVSITMDGNKTVTATFVLLPVAFNKGSPADGLTGVSANPVLNWLPSSGMDYYEYCYDTTDDDACSNWFTTSERKNTISGLTPNTTYYWQARAVNSAGVTYANGSETSYWSFTTANLPGVFGKAILADGTSGASINPTLTWGASSEATTYEYCYDTTNDGVCSTWVSTGGARYVFLSGLSPATSYYWQVRASNSFGMTYANGGETAYWTFTTINPPGAFGKGAPANGQTGASINPSLIWGPSSGVSTYEYCYDTTDDGACSNWINNGGSRTVTLSGLTPGTSYYWQVRAKNSTGTTYANGSETAYWTFTTINPPGAFGKAILANDTSGASINPTLTWGASSGASTYEYCYDTTDDGTCSTWVSTGGARYVFLSGLSPATSYYWQVRAKNSTGTTYADGLETAYWTFATINPPGAFGKGAPANGQTGASINPSLIWGPSSGVSTYEYCYDTTDDGACSNWINNGGSRTVTLSGLNPGTSYYWQVRAKNSTGTTYANGSETAYWTFTTINPPGAFGKAILANDTSGASINPTLTWGASSGASTYEYCYDTTDDGTCSTWVSTGGARYVFLSGLSPATSYYWQVRAKNSTGTTYADGLETAYWTFATINPPGAFGKGAPANGQTGASINPSLIWGPSSGVSTYEYCYDTTDDGACSNWINNGGSRTVTLSGLTPGTSYYWQVRAKNSTGTTYANGSETAYWTFTTINPPGAFGKAILANGTSGASINPTLTWGASSGASTYEYCYDTTDDGTCSTWVSTGGARYVFLSGLSPATSYYWQVRAKNSTGTTYADGSETAYWSFTIAP